MKKTSVLLFAAIMLLAAACSRGGTEPQQTPAPSPSMDPIAALAASDTDTAAAQANTPPASDTDTAVNSVSYRTAINYIGRSVSDLYAAVGAPIGTPIYSPDEDQEGVDTGRLQYDGYYVETTRDASGETVREVYLDEEDDAPIAGG